MREEQYQWQIVDRIQMGHSSSSVMANNLTLTWNTLCLESMLQVVSVLHNIKNLPLDG